MEIEYWGKNDEKSEKLEYHIPINYYTFFELIKLKFLSKIKKIIYFFFNE